MMRHLPAERNSVDGPQTRSREERSRLIALAGNGDEPAMAQLMEDAWPAVFRYLRGLGAAESDAPDLVQEALIRGMTKLDRYMPQKADFHTWLCAIARNLYIDMLRKRERELLVSPLPPDPDDPTTPLAAAALPELRDPHDDGFPDLDLREQLAHLPADVRFAVLMKVVHGLTNKAVGRLLGIPEGTVKSKVHYGLLKLRKGLDGCA